MTALSMNAEEFGFPGARIFIASSAIAKDADVGKPVGIVIKRDRITHYLDAVPPQQGDPPGDIKLPEGTLHFHILHEEHPDLTVSLAKVIQAIDQRIGERGDMPPLARPKDANTLVERAFTEDSSPEGAVVEFLVGEMPTALLPLLRGHLQAQSGQRSSRGGGGGGKGV